jgi:hypothetical protein
MFTPYEASRKFKETCAAANSCVREVLRNIQPTAHDIVIPANQNVCDAITRESVYVLKDGFLRYERSGRLLFCIESGELVGWGEHFFAEDVKVFGAAPLTVDSYNREHFLATTSSPTFQKTWNRFVELNLELLSILLTQLVPADVKVGPVFIQVKAGMPFIVEGSTPTDVFTLVQGDADVFVKDVKVGTVLNGEIFGAMSGEQRSASVIARTDCVAMVYPKEHFLELVKTHPQTVQRLIENMARIITTQNEKFVEMVRA